jgi:hypothetical protein
MASRLATDRETASRSMPYRVTDSEENGIAREDVPAWGRLLRLSLAAALESRRDDPCPAQFIGKRQRRLSRRGEAPQTVHHAKRPPNMAWEFGGPPAMEKDGHPLCARGQSIHRASDDTP